jgi:hypothetical protein
MEAMERTLRTGTMLEVDVQMDRLEQTAKKREESTMDMQVMVLHSELPQGCTCTETKMGGGEISHRELKGDCRNDHCMTCAARNPHSGYNQKPYPIQGSAILEHWTDMKTQRKFKDWGPMEKIDRFCTGLTGQAAVELEWLSRMGAVRMTTNEVMEWARVHSSTEGYHVRMVNMNKPLEPSLAYVMYEEMGDKIYALALDMCTQDPETIWTSQTMKGTMTKCILALGYLYQTHICDQLEGIMELVVWIEETVKAPENTSPPENNKEEDRPVTTKRFQQGINMLKEMMEVQKIESAQQARRIREVMRESQEELILKTLEATVAYTRTQ